MKSNYPRYRTQIKCPNISQVQELTKLMLGVDSHKKRPIKLQHQNTFDPERNKLKLDNHQFGSIPILRDQIQSSVLLMKNNKIKTMKGIDNYNNLNYLDISNNCISEITHITNLFLKVLIISSNKLTQLSNLPCCLKVLDASSNQIVQVNLSTAKNLKILQLSNNLLNDIDLTGLLKLQKANVDDNKITKLLELPLLPRLSNFSANSNCFVKLFDYKQLEKIPNIRYLFFRNNPATRLITQENYLDYLLDSNNNQLQPIKQQQTISRPRCKSVENRNQLKLEINDIVMREKSIPKLSIMDVNSTTPLPKQFANKQQLLNQRLLQRIIQKQLDPQHQNYRTEVTISRQQQLRNPNQFTVKQATLNTQSDSRFIKKIDQKSKIDIFTMDEIQVIFKIKQLYTDNQPINICLYKYFENSRSMICYGNPSSIEQLDVNNILLKYFRIEDLKQCDLFQLNTIQSLTLKNNQINYLYQIDKLKSFFQSLQSIIIERNQVCKSSLLKSYLNQLFNLDDKQSFQQYFNLKNNSEELNEYYIPPISLYSQQITTQFDQYIEHLILQQLI